MVESVKDPKRKAVNSAAFETFMTYGYKRTTMDDIAKAAGMSRPALYLIHKNKKDVFRACVIDLMETLELRLADIVGSPATPIQKVDDVLRAGIQEPHELVLSMPHGMDIFDIKSDIAPDLFDAWLKQLEQAIVKIIDDGVSAGRLSLDEKAFDAEQIAALIIDGAEGVKLRNVNLEEMPQRLKALTSLVLGPLAV